MSTESRQDDAVVTRDRPSVKSAEQIAERALIWQSLHLRGWLEDEAIERKRLPMARAIERGKQILEWIESEGLRAAVESDEWEILSTPVGRLHPSDVLSCYWKMDGLGVLVWAMGKLESLPPYDAPFDPQMVLHSLPKVGEESGEFRKAATRLEETLLKQSLEAADLWLWRADIHTQEPAANENSSQERTQAIERAAQRARKIGALDLIQDGDFTVMASRYNEITDEQQELLHSLAQERRHTLNWICGDAE